MEGNGQAAEVRVLFVQGGESHFESDWQAVPIGTYLRINVILS